MIRIKEVALSASSWLKQLSLFAQAAILAMAALLPLLFMNTASADQLTSRSVTISDSVVSQTGVEYDFDFTIPTNTTVQGIVLEFCTTPLGTCTLPTGMNVNRTLTVFDSQSGLNATGTWAEFTTDNTGDCDDIDGSSDDTMYCIANGSAASTTAGAIAIDLSAITNPSAIQSVYIRISLYSDDDFQPADLVHQGTVAAAIVDQLQVSGRVQERLDFCVAALGEAEAEPSGVAACSALTDQNVDIGVVDESSIAISPVDVSPTNGADDDYGILMVNTNAGVGVVISYYAEDASAVVGGDTDQIKSFRVVPANCAAASNDFTDQCFQSASGTGNAIATGTEMFGMYIACVDISQQSAVMPQSLDTPGTGYGGDDGSIASAADCETETSANVDVAWNSTSSAATLVSSNGVVDDEIVKLRFAATASPTTPSGNYTVVTTYIATATF